MQIVKKKIETIMFLVVADKSGREWNFISNENEVTIAKKDSDDFFKLSQEQQEELANFVSKEF